MSGRYLLDSHVFLWLADDRAPVKTAVRHSMDSATEIYLSAISIAELGIKSSLGKLKPPPPIEQDPLEGFAEIMGRMGVDILPLDLAAAAALHVLPRHHGDPFDRLLVAQAMTAKLTLVTHDKHMGAYEGLQILWA